MRRAVAALLLSLMIPWVTLAQVGVPGRPKGRVSTPEHAHRDLSDGGRIPDAAYVNQINTFALQNTFNDKITARISTGSHAFEYYQSLATYPLMRISSDGTIESQQEHFFWPTTGVGDPSGFSYNLSSPTGLTTNLASYLPKAGTTDTSITILSWVESGLEAGLQPGVGTVLYGGGNSRAMQPLTIGSSGQILTSNGWRPQWSTSSSVVDVARTWTTLQTFPDNTLKITGSAASTKTAVFELDGASAGADLTLAWSGTADRTATVPDATTTLAGLAVTQTFTKPQTIDPDADAVALTLQRANAEVADFLRFDGDNGSPVTFGRIDGNGSGHFGDGSAAGVPLVLYTAASGDAGSFSGSFSTFNLTANRTFTLPDATGTVELNSNSATLSNKTISTSGNTLRASTASSGVAWVDNASTGKALRMVLSGLTASTNNTLTFSATGARNWAIGDEEGLAVMVGDEAVSAGSSATAKKPGKFDITARGSDIASTTLVTTPTAGLWRIDYYLACTSADATAGTITLTYTSTDDVGSNSQTATRIMTATGRTTGSFVLYSTTANQTFTIAITGIYGTAQFAARLRATYLG